MRAEGGPGGCGAAVAVGLALLALPLAPARARAVMGRAVVQFQDVRQRLLVTNPDGTTRWVDQHREVWAQNYELTQSDYLRPDLNLFWQLQLNDVATRGIKLNQRTPYGLVRMTHPAFGASASYRPATTTTAFPGPTGLQPLFTDHRQDTQLTAYLAPARLPRLDLTWTRRHREPGNGTANSTGTNRAAQLAYGVGTLAAHAGYTDQGVSGAGGPAALLQRGYNAGAAYVLGVSGRRSLGLAYEYSGSERVGKLVDRSESHAVTASGVLRQSVRSQWTLNYILRRSLLFNQVSTGQTDHDGSLLYNFQASRAARLIAGGGLRTERLETGTGILKYVTAVIGADGTWKNIWRATASASHTSNWSVERPAYSTQGYHAGSRLELTSRIGLDVDLLVSANTDSAARSSRYVAQSSAGAQLTPLRGLVVRLSGRRYQAGATPFAGSAVSRGVGLNVRLGPVRDFDLTADFASNGSLPRNDPRVTTTQINANLNPTRRLRLSGYFSRSDRTQRVAAADALGSRELIGGRLTGALSRRLTLIGGINVGDPGRPTHSRQADASLTWTFGGPS